MNEADVPAFQVLKGGALFLLVAWTVVANSLVFIVLHKNPRLQTVPNLLVGNLAFSDLCLGLIVLPLSSVYAIYGEWLFPETLCELFVSADILCSTASIWNLSIVGLDRYWAITSPVAYMNRRTKKTACIMIISVWVSSAFISLAPSLGWKQVALGRNLVYMNGTAQCTFLDLPSYTVYSATGSFFIPTLLMFFVYFKIYQAFAKHRARQIYRQKVIRKHIESTILHEISHVLPTSDEFAKEEEEEDSESSEKVENGLNQNNNGCIEEEDEMDFEDSSEKMETETTAVHTSIKERQSSIRKEPKPNLQLSKSVPAEKCVGFQKPEAKAQRSIIAISYEKVQKHKIRKERVLRKSLQRKPKAISAAKERRGVKVLGIILGCFTICWTPFFIMYVLAQFCNKDYCKVNPHIEMFITWLGYSNSAMNPIIYTVFNRDYQIALKRLFSKDSRPPRAL